MSYYDTMYTNLKFYRSICAKSSKKTISMNAINNFTRVYMQICDCFIRWCLVGKKKGGTRAPASLFADGSRQWRCRRRTSG